MNATNWINEDTLPEDLSNEDYDDWFAQSRVIDGVRMGPPFPLPPIDAIRMQCRFCGAEIWSPSDNPEPTCDECDEKEGEFLRVSYAQEGSFAGVAEGAIEEEQW